MSGFTPHEFISRWKQATARERQTCQEHFIDLCRLIGIDLAHRWLDYPLAAAAFRTL